MKEPTDTTNMQLPNEDELEELIQSLPLKSPSANCDARVLECLNPKEHALPSGDPVSLKPGSRPSTGLLFFVASTAAALTIGFMLGTLVNRTAPKQMVDDNPTNSQQTLAGFGLAENVKIVEGKSKTLIVADRIQMQNNVPVRKLETVTHKKVRVRNSKDQPEKELDIPIRKVFFTLAETI